MSYCRTHVEDGGKFRQCGKPALVSVMVGSHRCNYCLEHAAAARRFVEQQGQERITDLQRKVPNGGS